MIINHVHDLLEMSISDTLVSRFCNQLYHGHGCSYVIASLFRSVDILNISPDYFNRQHSMCLSHKIITLAILCNIYCPCYQLTEPFSKESMRNHTGQLWMVSWCHDGGLCFFLFVCFFIVGVGLIQCIFCGTGTVAPSPVSDGRVPCKFTEGVGICSGRQSYGISVILFSIVIFVFSCFSSDRFRCRGCMVFNMC